jgi:hypothetical protein
MAHLGTLGIAHAPRHAHFRASARPTLRSRSEQPQFTNHRSRITDPHSSITRFSPAAAREFIRHTPPSGAHRALPADVTMLHVQSNRHYSRTCLAGRRVTAQQSRCFQSPTAAIRIHRNSLKTNDRDTAQSPTFPYIPVPRFSASAPLSNSSANYPRIAFAAESQVAIVFLKYA